MQCDSPGLGGGCAEDRIPLQASCSLSQGIQVCFGVKYTEEGELLGPGAPSLPVPFGVAFSGCFPVALLMSAPGIAFRASAIFIKAVLNTFT